jgi:hypothetical protein
MATATYSDHAGRIEAELKARGLDDTIPAGGLDHWVAQGWTLDELQDADPAEGADLWIEQLGNKEATRTGEATEWTAIQIDEENGSQGWWDALDATYPALSESLRKNRVAVIKADLWGRLAALPGFDDGPEFAPNPILDCGGDGDQWADVVGRKHNVFETVGDLAEAR